MSESPPPRKPADNLTGLALVLLQFALIGAIAWRIARASAGATRRLLSRAKMKPTASTPSSPARRTSPARVMPQNLMRVR